MRTKSIKNPETCNFIQKLHIGKEIHLKTFDRHDHYKETTIVDNRRELKKHVCLHAKVTEPQREGDS
jgi:hypothetical protein